MPYRVLETFDTGTKKILITLEENVDSYEKVIRISESAGYFVMFDIHNEFDGKLSARFLAEKIKGIVKTSRRNRCKRKSRKS